jgi:hypothetical protein
MNLTAKRRTFSMVASALLLGAVTAGSALAGDHCFYRGTMYSDGAANCQEGHKFRCDDGDWKKQDGACEGEQMAGPSRTCEFEGIAFSTGSASCQSGTQYRCEDGSWRNIHTSCTVGDAPMKVTPSGRTCMYEGATVSSGSTICRGGDTFLCNNGDWSNLGTACR